METAAVCSTHVRMTHQKQNTKLNQSINKKLHLPAGKKNSPLTYICIHTGRNSPKQVQLNLTRFTVRILFLYDYDLWCLLLQQLTSLTLVGSAGRVTITFHQNKTFWALAVLFLRSHRYC